jgi:hypothetical protein
MRGKIAGYYVKGTAAPKGIYCEKLRPSADNCELIS